MKVVNVVKEKAIITIITEDGRNATVNLNNNTYTNFAGKQVQFIRTPLSFVDDMAKYNVIGQLIAKRNAWDDLHNLETFWNVIDLIGEDIPTENPKGYVKFVQENNETLCEETLEKFLEEQKIKKQEESLSETEKKSWYVLLSNCYYLRARRLDFSTEDVKKLCKLLKNSLKDIEHSFELSWLFSSFFPLINQYESLRNFINYDRGVYFNLQNLRAMANKIRNEQIIANEQKISFVMQLETDNLCVVVPSAIEDFTKEGEMQHNCVGYHYHDDISKGQAYIYFIRKKSSKEHSYVTCRYSPRCRRTVEYRIINNEDCTDNEACELIKKVDKMINKIL